MMSPRYDGFRGYNPYLDGGGAAPFIPSDMPNAAYWCRADLDAFAASWTCQISGVRFTEGVPANQPTLASSVAELAGKPAFQFRSASQQRLQANNGATAWRFLHEGPMTVAMPVVSRGGVAHSAWGTGDSAVSGSVGSNVQLYDGATDFVTYFNVNGSGFRVVDSQPAITGGTLQDIYRVLVHTYDFGAAAEYTNQLDSTVLDSGGTGRTPAAADPNGPFTLAAGIDGAGVLYRFGNVDIPEFVILSGIPTAPDLSLLLNYFDSRYV